MSSGTGSAALFARRNCRGVIFPWSSIMREHVAATQRRAPGCCTGSYSDGSAGIPARSAASASVELLRALLEVRARGLLDPVRAVAEVDRVEVRGEDPVLAPALLELPGERRLAHLARERPLVADVRVLDELLRDRRAALDDALLADVLPERAADAAHVDAVVLEEALVLDRDDRLAHDRRDVLGVTRTRLSSPRSTASTRRAVRRVDDRVDVRVLRCRVERGNLARDRADEAERERSAGSDDEDAQQRRKPSLANPAPRTRRPLLSPNPQGGEV